MKMVKKVIIGSDHAGFKLKERIKKELDKKFQFDDMGTKDETPVDYPVYAEKVAKKVVKNPKFLGVLTCGSGIGMSIAANKVKGVRAALCYTKKAAELAREHNNANILVIPGREEPMDNPIEIVKTFLNTKFSSDARHKRRIKEIGVIEK